MRSSALHVSNLESYIGCKVLQNDALNPLEALSASPSAPENGKSRGESATKVLEFGMDCSIDSNMSIRKELLTQLVKPLAKTIAKRIIRVLRRWCIIFQHEAMTIQDRILNSVFRG